MIGKFGCKMNLRNKNIMLESVSQNNKKIISLKRFIELFQSTIYNQNVKFIPALQKILNKK